MAETRKSYGRLADRTISRQSPEDLQIEDYLAKPDKGPKGTPALKDIRQLIDATISDPDQWYSWKFYYHTNDVGRKSTVSGYASMFRTHGKASQSVNKVACVMIEAAIENFGGHFEAQYTNHMAQSDDLKSGNYMHVVFVRWVPPVVPVNSNGPNPERPSERAMRKSEPVETGIGRAAQVGSQILHDPRDT